MAQTLVDKTKTLHTKRKQPESSLITSVPSLRCTWMSPSPPSPKKRVCNSLPRCASSIESTTQTQTADAKNSQMLAAALQMDTCTMSPEEEIEHLLDAAQYLRTEDFNGYTQHFLSPQDRQPKVTAKKHRGSPGRCLQTFSLPDCANQGGKHPCGQGTTMEDVREGCVVCIQCGLIQSMSILESVRTGATFHSGVSPIAVHHYSRIVHWVENIASMQGETKLTITPTEEAQLLAFCLKEEHRVGKGVFAVREALRRGIIPYRFLRHAPALAFRLWPRLVKLPSLSDKDVRAVLLRLRKYEDAWHLEILGNGIFKRKNFPAFRFMWPIIVEDLNLVHLADMVKPLVVGRCLRKLGFIVNAMKLRILEEEAASNVKINK